MRFRQYPPFRHNTIAGSIAVAFSMYLAGCSGEIRPTVTAGLDACAQCNMIIDTVNQACGYVHEGDFVTFDSPGCLLRSSDGLRRQGSTVPTLIYFADYGSSEFVPAEQTVFLLTDHIPTVMDAGVLCFSTAEGARATSTATDEEITDWRGLRRLRGQPDAIVEATITPTGLSPEIIDVTKGDLVLFKLDGGHLPQEITISVRGYPEIGEIAVTTTGEPTELRFYATRPGAGFPIVSQNDEPLGMLRVAGAHTADEEAL